MGKSAPPSPDYMGVARLQADASRDLQEQQTRANRPNINTPYAFQRWEQGPNGQWTMNTGFQGETAALAEALRGQAAQNMTTPFDMSQFGDLPTGDSARNQAIEAAYSQASSRLNPQWGQREDATRTRLLNQGLTEGSEAWNNAMGELGRQRNDAYSSAMNSAIMQGTAAGDSAFRNSMASRQQALAEALRSRQLPMAELAQLQQQMGMPAFQGSGRAETPQFMQAAQAQGAADLQGWLGANQANADIWRNAIQVAGTIGTIAASDARLKQNITYLPREAAPGVPLATWEYKSEPGQRYRGVIAQDVQKHYPHLVVEGPDGMLYVDAIFAPEPLS